MPWCKTPSPLVEFLQILQDRCVPMLVYVAHSLPSGVMNAYHVQAEFALSEESIVSNSNSCGTTETNNAVLTQLRADYTNCALPAQAITGACIPGYVNEPENCGFQSNLNGLCAYCNASSINATDSCCVTSRVESRCNNVVLPVFTSMGAIFATTTSMSTLATSTSRASTTTTSSGNPTSTGGTAVSAAERGLSGGAIAGVVVGSVLGAALLLGLLIFFCVTSERKKKREKERIDELVNKPRPNPSISQGALPPPGGRIMGISALEGSEKSSSASSPARQRDLPPQRAVYPGDGNSPPSEPEKPASSTQSAQLNAFKDYYSDELIHPNDTVSILWAYQPRAPDEFELERGDMLRIIGMWDDGWATGVRLPQRAQDWDPDRNQRDSVVSDNPGNVESPPTSWQIKAFPVSADFHTFVCIATDTAADGLCMFTAALG